MSEQFATVTIVNLSTTSVKYRTSNAMNSVLGILVKSDSPTPIVSCHAMTQAHGTAGGSLSLVYSTHST